MEIEGRRLATFAFPVFRSASPQITFSLMLQDLPSAALVPPRFGARW